MEGIKTRHQELRSLLGRRPLATSEIISALKISQPSLSRLLKTMPDVLPIGETNHRVYALLRSQERYPIVKVGENAEIFAQGELCLLQPKGTAFVPLKGSSLKPR